MTTLPPNLFPMLKPSLFYPVRQNP